MKGWVQGKRFFVFASALLACLIMLDAYFIFLWKPAGAMAAGDEPGKYEIRSMLLTEAMKRVGSCSPTDAASVWADGVKQRNGAQQYAGMSDDLKKEYARDLEQTYPNWVTGVSSPWVEGYDIAEDKIDADNYSYHIRFDTATSAGPAEDCNVVIIVSREGLFWRVSEVAGQKGMGVYTGFR